MDTLLSSILWELTADTYSVQYLLCAGMCLCTLNVLMYLLLTGTLGGVYFLIIPSLQVRRLRHRGEVTCQESGPNQWWGELCVLNPTPQQAPAGWGNRGVCIWAGPEEQSRRRYKDVHRSWLYRWVQITMGVVL